MQTIGIVLVAIFGVIFVGLVLYLLIDNLRTGELFRQRGLLPFAFCLGIIAFIGIYLTSVD